MPAKSPKQYRFMAACAHGGKLKAKCPPESVARKFVEETPKAKRKSFSKKGG